MERCSHKFFFHFRDRFDVFFFLLLDTTKLEMYYISMQYINHCSNLWHHGCCLFVCMFTYLLSYYPHAYHMTDHPNSHPPLNQTTGTSHNHWIILPKFGASICIFWWDMAATDIHTDTVCYTDHLKLFLFLSFRRVLNVICSFLGNSPASES